MAGKGKWAVITYLVDKELLVLCLRPPVVYEEWDMHPIWLGDYIFSYINAKYLPITMLSAIQYGQELENILMEVVLADPALGAVYLLT